VIYSEYVEDNRNLARDGDAIGDPLGGPDRSLECRTMSAAPATTFRVRRIDWTAGIGAYYADDLAAIRAGATADGLFYTGAPVTPGHTVIRQPARAMLMRVETEDGTTAWGDAVTPQYSGFGGRDLPIDPDVLAPQVEAAAAALVAAGPLDFAGACAVVEAVEQHGSPLHTGVRYGLSQALLELAARAAGISPLRILTAMTGLDEPTQRPVYAQSGDDRYRNVDAMIMHRVEVLPHGLINGPTAFGDEGTAFLEYVRWVVTRVAAFGDPSYTPRLHFDIYGMLGQMTGNDVDAMVGFCAALDEAAGPRRVQLEAPAYGEDETTTIALLADLRRALRDADVDVAIVADEYCNGLGDVRRFVEAGAVDLIQIKMPDLGAITNALEAAAICRQGGLGVFIGGSCAETDLGGEVSALVGLAVGADQILAKPGMGFDEGVAIVRNTMARALLAWHLDA
jgi:methylaspartate ammonia-lyase